MIKLKTQNWVIENIDTVIFDKDGTFIDLHYFWGKMTEMRAMAIIKFLGLNITYLEKIALLLGYSIKSGKMSPNGITALYSRTKIIEIFKSELEKINLVITKSDIEKIFDEVSQEFYKEIEKYIKPIEEALDFIKKIRKLGLKTGIVTSDSVESTMLTLKLYKWEDLFDTVIGRESINETKESGVPTKLALNNLSANPKNTLMIGDAPMDYVSAKNAGINNIILVATGQISLNELMQTTDFTIDTLRSIECLEI